MFYVSNYKLVILTTFGGSSVNQIVNFSKSGKQGYPEFDVVEIN